MEARNLRKERTGVVLSNKMEKTITVAAKLDVYKRQLLACRFILFINLLIKRTNESEN